MRPTFNISTSPKRFTSGFSLYDRRLLKIYIIRSAVRFLHGQEIVSHEFHGLAIPFLPYNLTTGVYQSAVLVREPHRCHVMPDIEDCDEYRGRNLISSPAQPHNPLFLSCHALSSGLLQGLGVFCKAIAESSLSWETIISIPKS